MKRFLLIMLLVVLPLVAGCEKLPGQKGPWELGPLSFGMSLEQTKAAFSGLKMELDAYDTPRGQTWTVVEPFADDAPKPRWLTEPVERISLTFWDDSLIRVRLHLSEMALAQALLIREKFDRGYTFTQDLSKGENLWLEYEADNLKVFLSNDGSNVTVVAFVDLPAYRAMDVARRRWQKQAAESWQVDGLKFGIGLEQAREALGHELTPSDFFDGLESREWIDQENGVEWYLGFDVEFDLSAVARVHRKLWSPQMLREKVNAWTRDYGQGEIRPGPNGYTVVIDCDNVRLSLIVMHCNAEGCRVSEGWLWSGPSLR